MMKIAIAAGITGLAFWLLGAFTLMFVVVFDRPIPDVSLFMFAMIALLCWVAAAVIGITAIELHFRKSR